MGFSIIPILSFLFIVIGIYKRKKNYGKLLLVIGVLFLSVTLYMIFLVKFRMTKGLE